MIKRLCLFLTVLVLLANNAAVYGQSANDHIFPASATAKPYIDFDSKGPLFVLTPVWRFDPKDLGHGSAWVNGHNIGRYPEKIAAPGLYIPDCWLNKGLNQLVIYDEDGKRPSHTLIIAEPGASRATTKISANLN